MLKINKLMIGLMVTLTINLPTHCYAKNQPQTQQKSAQWRTLSPDDTLYIETENGRVIIELATNFSPRHVERVKKLVRSGFYDGLDFYRVIDTFVVQGGDMAETSSNPLAKQTIKSEFEWPIDSSKHYTLVQEPDLLAEQTGFIDGFAVGRDSKEGKEWLISCPGVINLARTADIHSASTDFAIMMGQAPRHLDRNMSIFGRIIDGMPVLNHIKRGDAKNGGVIEDPKARSKIVKMTIASDLPKAQQQTIKIENTHSENFKQKIKERRERANPFYLHKGNGAIDICYIKPDVSISQ